MQYLYAIILIGYARVSTGEQTTAAQVAALKTSGCELIFRDNEFERAMLKERTKAGLDAARKEGRIGGRPPKLKPHQQQEIVTLVKQGKKTAADAARLFGVHPATVSRLLRRT